MSIFQDWIVMVLLVLVGFSVYFSLRVRFKDEIWLLLLLVFLFALPRTGIMLSQVNLPLPVGYVLVAIMIIEWLIFREIRQRGNRRFNLFFIIYASIAGIGLVLGLSTGGYYLTAFLELCFYLFAIGLFFYVSETFSQKQHFIYFMRIILIISFCVSLYGIAQKQFGASILVNNVTYNSATGLARAYLEIPFESRRVLSSYGDPNVLAAQLVVFYAIAMALFVGRQITFHTRLFAGMLLLASSLCIICTGSRAGILCLVIVPVIMLCWQTRWFILAIPVLLWIGITNFSFWLNFLLGNRLSMNPWNGDIRFQFPTMAWELLKNFPFGCGFGKAISMKLYGLNWTIDAGTTQSIWGGFNSFWLNLFSRLGAPGVIAFALFLLVIFIFVIRSVKHVREPQVRQFIIGAVTGFFAMMLIWLVNNTYMLPGGVLNFWFLLGMVVAGCRAFTTADKPVVLLPYSPSLPLAAPAVS